jgi:hypothetical protein
VRQEITRAVEPDPEGERGILLQVNIDDGLIARVPIALEALKRMPERNAARFSALAGRS